jgi:hypothetical protein
MQIWLEQLLAALEHVDTLGSEGIEACRQQSRFVRSATSDEIEALLAALLEHWPHDDAASASLPNRAKQLEALLGTILEQLWLRCLPAEGASGEISAGTAPLSARSIDLVQQLYRDLGPQQRMRYHLLRALAADASPQALAAFAELAASDPPQAAKDAALAFVPLVQYSRLPAQALYPRLLDALAQPSTATLVLDVSNHFTRRGLLPKHPAAPRVAELAGLLSGIVQRLNLLEEQAGEGAKSAQELQQKVAEAVALLVPLCDALALIGDASVIGKLHQALALGHRRLRTEAAGALARLGDEQGVAALAQLTAEPVVRPIALAYLEELGQLDRASAQFRTPVARAEGELARWLSQPTRFALPPQQMELVDACTQHWPGFDEPVDCFLFRYDYRLPQGHFSGVGIGAPIAYSFYADLQDLPPSDIYAIYAGWSAEHEELTETEAAALSPEQLADWEQARQRLQQSGFDDVQLAKLGHFFSQDVPVAVARRSGQPGVLVVDNDQVIWLPQRGASRPIGPTEAYYLYKGRKILAAFNREV